MVKVDRFLSQHAAVIGEKARQGDLAAAKLIGIIEFAGNSLQDKNLLSEALAGFAATHSIPFEIEEIDPTGEEAVFPPEAAEHTNPEDRPI